MQGLSRGGRWRRDHSQIVILASLSTHEYFNGAKVESSFEDIRIEEHRVGVRENVALWLYQRWNQGPCFSALRMVHLRAWKARESLRTKGTKGL